MAFPTRASLCLSAVLLATGPVYPHELDIEDRVRAYILENPEIILQALTILSQREERAAIRERVGQFPYLFADTSQLGIGKATAETRIVKFFDYRCAPCKAIHPTLKSFVAEHTDIRIELRHLPILSPGSERAARFALATKEVLGSSAYTEVHQALWNLRGPLNRDAFIQIATQLGYDFALIEAAMQAKAVTKQIAQNRDAAIALEILGTPAFVTSHSIHSGGLDFDTMSEIWLSQ